MTEYLTPIKMVAVEKNNEIMCVGEDAEKLE